MEMEMEHQNDTYFLSVDTKKEQQERAWQPRSVFRAAGSLDFGPNGLKKIKNTISRGALRTHAAVPDPDGLKLNLVVSGEKI
jgi:hypothetical protein